MSWAAAGKLARQLAEKYRRCHTRVSRERMQALEDALATLDREALIQLMHERIADEFLAFKDTCLMNEAAEEPTMPEVPWRLPSLLKR